MQNNKISIVVSSASLFYSLALVVPGTLYCLLSQNGSGFDYYAIVSIYGYSLLNFIFPCIFSYFLNYWIKWAVWSVAAAFSLVFLKKNLGEEIERILPNQKFLAAGVVLIGHLCLILSANLYFLTTK